MIDKIAPGYRACADNCLGRLRAQWVNLMSMVKNLVYGLFGLLLALPLAAKVQQVDSVDLVPDATHRQVARSRS